MISIRLPDGSQRQFPGPVTVGEVAGSIGPGLAKAALGGRVGEGQGARLVDTSYRLTPEGQGTRLDIHVTYRVSTNFNWYANVWGRMLVDDSARTILQFYKHRAEASASDQG